MSQLFDAVKRNPRRAILAVAVISVLAAECGCHIVTVPHELLDKVAKLGGMDLAELSLDTVRMFHKDAVAAGFKL